MTELLKETLREQADALPTPAPDLDAILSDGRSRVRRRRGLGGVLAAAALVGAALVVPSQLDAWGSKDDETNVAANETPQLSWAAGSVIHAGTEQIDVGHDINAYVETARGYVFTDAGGTVFQWEAGQVLALGKVVDQSGQRDLITDGKATAWLDVTDGEWSFAVTEKAGVVRRLPAQIPAAVAEGGDGLSSAQAQTRERTRVMALDQDTLYAGDQRGVLAFDLTSGDVSVLTQRPGVAIEDAESGRLLFTDERSPADAGATGSTYYASDLQDDTGSPLAVEGGDLSPGARYVMSENSATNSDDFTLVALADGTSFAPDQKTDYDFFLGYAWIDADTYRAFGLSAQGDSWEVEAMTCSASGRSCESVVPLPGTQDVETEGFGFQLPIGEHIG